VTSAVRLQATDSAEVGSSSEASSNHVEGDAAEHEGIAVRADLQAKARRWRLRETTPMTPRPAPARVMAGESNMWRAFLTRFSIFSCRRIDFRGTSGKSRHSGAIFL
jgi:hypothetical protein